MSDIPSTKPYLVRAIYEWCVDAGFTPYLAVTVGENVRVPQAFIKDGQIVLNIAPHATHQFQLDNDAMSCQARFNGAAQNLYVPIANIAAIYARENGQGMAFEVTVTKPEQSVPAIEQAPAQTPPDEPDSPEGGSRGHLRRIK